MRNFFGYFLILFAVLIYIIGILALAKEVHYSLEGLKLTLTNSTLLGGFIGFGLGVMGPGFVLHYFGLKLLKPKKAKKGDHGSEL